MKKLIVALSKFVCFSILINSCSNPSGNPSNAPNNSMLIDRSDLINFSGVGAISDTLHFSFTTQVLDTSINDKILNTGKLGMELWGLDLTISAGNKMCVQYFNLMNEKLDTVFSYSLASYSAVLDTRWAALSKVTFYKYNNNLYKLLTLESFYSTYTIYLDNDNTIAAYVFEAMRDFKSVNPENLDLNRLTSKANLIEICELYPMLLEP